MKEDLKLQYKIDFVYTIHAWVKNLSPKTMKFDIYFFVYVWSLVPQKTTPVSSDLVW